MARTRVRVMEGLFLALRVYSHRRRSQNYLVKTR